MSLFIWDKRHKSRRYLNVCALLDATHLHRVWLNTGWGGEWRRSHKARFYFPGCFPEKRPAAREADGVTFDPEVVLSIPFTPIIPV